MVEKRFAGAGRIVWHELSTVNVGKAEEFYGGLFGWRFEDPDPLRLQQAYEVEVWTLPGGKGQAMWDPPPGAGASTSVPYNNDGAALTLVDGEDYYLRVRVTNDTGIRSPWNEIRFHLNSLPPLPNRPNPADGALTPPLSDQQLCWEAGGLDPESDVLHQHSLDGIAGEQIALLNIYRSKE